MADVEYLHKNSIKIIAPHYFQNNLPQINELSPIETINQIDNWRHSNRGTANFTSRKLQRIVKHLKSNNLAAACDGSVYKNKAAHAWSLIRKDNGKIILSGCAPVLGDPINNGINKN